MREEGQGGGRADDGDSEGEAGICAEREREVKWGRVGGWR